MALWQVELEWKTRGTVLVEADSADDAQNKAMAAHADAQRGRGGAEVKSYFETALTALREAVRDSPESLRNVEAAVEALRIKDARRPFGFGYNAALDDVLAAIARERK
jgi:hypothetical protein